MQPSLSLSVNWVSVGIHCFLFHFFLNFDSAIRIYLHVIHLDWMCINAWTLFQWYEYLRFVCMILPNRAPSTQYTSTYKFRKRLFGNIMIDTISMHLLFSSKAIHWTLNSFVCMFCYHWLFWWLLHLKCYRCCEYSGCVVHSINWSIYPCC